MSEPTRGRLLRCTTEDQNKTNKIFFACHHQNQTQNQPFFLRGDAMASSGARLVSRRITTDILPCARCLTLLNDCRL